MVTFRMRQRSSLVGFRLMQCGQAGLSPVMVAEVGASAALRASDRPSKMFGTQFLDQLKEVQADISNSPERGHLDLATVWISLDNGLNVID
jgi:hypothetical protein